MRKRIIILELAAVIALGAWLAAGGARRGGQPAPEPSAAAAAAGDVERGAVLGAFDPAMSGVCRFSCAASEPSGPAALAAQPGAPAGALTRCPVSGVVFAVGEERPRVAIETGDYRLCCDGCAEKFAKQPARFVRL